MCYTGFWRSNLSSLKNVFLAYLDVVNYVNKSVNSFSFLDLSLCILLVTCLSSSLSVNDSIASVSLICLPHFCISF